MSKRENPLISKQQRPLSKYITSPAYKDKAEAEQKLKDEKVLWQQWIVNNKMSNHFVGAETLADAFEMGDASQKIYLAAHINWTDNWEKLAMAIAGKYLEPNIDHLPSDTLSLWQDYKMGQMSLDVVAKKLKAKAAVANQRTSKSISAGVNRMEAFTTDKRNLYLIQLASGLLQLATGEKAANKMEAYIAIEASIINFISNQAAYGNYFKDVEQSIATTNFIILENLNELAGEYLGPGNFRSTPITD